MKASKRQSNNETKEIPKYMKSEMTSLKRKQEAVEFANPPRLGRLLDLSNNTW